MAGHLQWEVMAGYVTFSRLSGAPGGHSRIVPEPDFGDFLPQMHLRSGCFSSEHCAHAKLVDDSHVGSTCTVRLQFCFNCN